MRDVPDSSNPPAAEVPDVAETSDVYGAEAAETPWLEAIPAAASLLTGDPYGVEPPDDGEPENGDVS